jgi:hypothetical protein
MQDGSPIGFAIRQYSHTIRMFLQARSWHPTSRLFSTNSRLHRKAGNSRYLGYIIQAPSGFRDRCVRCRLSRAGSQTKPGFLPISTETPSPHSGVTLKAVCPPDLGLLPGCDLDDNPGHHRSVGLSGSSIELARRKQASRLRSRCHEKSAAPSPYLRFSIVMSIIIQVLASLKSMMNP